MIDKNQTNAYERIWQVINQIPTARVATYGQIAKLAGFKHGARLVGYALHNCPDGTPWHRVINAKGRISFPEDSWQYKKQRSLLLDEGIMLRDGRIDLTLHQWQKHAVAKTSI